MRFAISLFVVAVGAILAFGVTGSPHGVDIHVIGLILILAGLAGLAIARWLYTTRRRTDVLYHPNGQTWLEPNSPPPGEPQGDVGRHHRRPPPEPHPPRPDASGPPVTHTSYGSRRHRLEHGVLGAEPGSRSFRRFGLRDD